MSGLGLSLPVGVIALTLVFLILYRLTPLNGKQAAMAVSVLSIGAYTGYAAIHQQGVDVIVMHVAVFLVTAYVLGIVTSVRKAGGEEGKRWFYWGPALIIGFFVIVITVDAFFVSLSMKGLPEQWQDRILPRPSDAKKVHTVFPGVVHRNYYQKEKQFNRYLRSMELQRKRGWRVRKGWASDRPVAGTAQIFKIAVLDHEGRPVTGASVSGLFLRQSDSRLDQVFRMREYKPGYYRASVTLPVPGLWYLRLEIRRGKDLHRLQAVTSLYKSPR